MFWSPRALQLQSLDSWTEKRQLLHKVVSTLKVKNLIWSIYEKGDQLLFVRLCCVDWFLPFFRPQKFAQSRQNVNLMWETSLVLVDEKTKQEKFHGYKIIIYLSYFTSWSLPSILAWDSGVLPHLILRLVGAPWCSFRSGSQIVRGSSTLLLPNQHWLTSWIKVTTSATLLLTVAQ